MEPLNLRICAFPAKLPPRITFNGQLSEECMDLLLASESDCGFCNAFAVNPGDRKIFGRRLELALRTCNGACSVGSAASSFCVNHAGGRVRYADDRAPRR